MKKTATTTKRGRGRPRGRTGTAKDHRLWLRLDDEARAAVADEARSDRRTVAAELEVLVLEALAKRGVLGKRPGR